MNITKNKIINKYSIIGSSLLFFYIFCTLWIEKFVEIQDWPTINENWKNIGISGIITFEILWIYFYFKPKLEIKENPKISKLNFFIPLIISSIVLFIYYFAYYPGFFVYDSFEQIKWTKDSTDWYPVIHTLLSITIPLKLANNHIEIITFLQSIYYILALSYFIYALRKVNFSKWFCSIILIQSLLTPYSINILSVEKDYLFAIFCILTLSFYIQIISIPNWLTIPKAILFGIIITMCTLLRNNAPLFTFPLIINLFIFKKSNKNFLNISILSGLTLYFIIINPIYKTYNVYKIQNKDYLKIETTGIPFTIIGSIAKNDFDKFSTETQNDLLSIAPKTIWEKYEDTIDKYNGWNSIKFLIHWKRLNDTPLKRIFEIMFEAIQINPKKALLQTAIISHFLYTIHKKESTYTPPYKFLSAVKFFKYNNKGISFPNIQYIYEKQKSYTPYFLPTKLIKSCQTITNFLENKHKKLYTLVNIGTYLLILIAAICLSIINKNTINILHSFPILSYIFGTNLLLSGQEQRFFVGMYFLLLPTSYLILGYKYKKKKKSS